MKMLAALIVASYVVHVAGVNVTANYMTSVVHPDITLSWSKWNPCNTIRDVKSVPSFFFTTRDFDTQMQLQVGNATTLKTLCKINTTVEDRWKEIVNERYRYQFSVDGHPVLQTQKYTSVSQYNDIQIRTRGVAVATLQNKEIVPLVHLHFILSGACDETGWCEIGRAEVVPTYAHKSYITYDSQWKNTEDLVFERMDDVLSRDDETSHAAILGIVICGTFIVVTTFAVMLGVRKRLVPFLKKGSTIWAECGWWTWRSFNARMLEHEIELGTVDSLLVTTDDDPMLSEYDENAQWREFSADVMRTPPYANAIAVIVAAGVHTATFVTLILLPVLWRVRYTRQLLLYTFWCTTAVASLISSIVCVQVKVALRADTPRSLRSAYTACFCVPTLIIMCGLLSHGLHTTNVLMGVCVWAAICFSISTCGVSIGSAIVQMPKLRINKVPRPCAPMDKVSKIVTVVSPALAYTGVSIPVLVVMQRNWGSHAVVALGLVYATGVLGLLLVGCAAVLLTFLMLCRGSYKWNWIIVAMGAAVGFYSCVGCMLMWAHLPTRGVHTALNFAMMQLTLSVGVALVCASIAWLAAHAFIISIYTNCKFD